jgi:hypothetical protein
VGFEALWPMDMCYVLTVANDAHKLMLRKHGVHPRAMLFVGSVVPILRCGTLLKLISKPSCDGASSSQTVFANFSFI